MQLDRPKTAPAEVCAAQLSYDAALAIMLAQAAPLTSERVAMARAGGRRLAADVVAQVDAPRCDVAAMDGYAVRADDAVVGRSLAVVAITYAGDLPASALAPQQSVRVMTGAPVPAGTHRVIPWEFVSRDDDRIHLRAVPAGRHIRTRAADFARGQTLLPAGRRLDPRALIVAAAGDHAQLPVVRRPRVRIIGTGDELARAGLARTTPLAVPDSLSGAIRQFALGHGAMVPAPMLLPDHRASITIAAHAMADQCDVLVMLGGAAQGERDHARTALTDLGMQLHFAGVAMKPGKPVWFGQLDNMLVLGLPGNPTAAMTIARLFLAPLLERLGGGSAEDAANHWCRAPLVSAIPANGPREAFLCATLIEGQLQLLERQSASMQLTLADADALLRRPANAPACIAGEIVDYVVI